MTSSPYCLEITVRFSDVDSNGHVNNQHYNSYCNEAMMHLFRAAGVDLETLSQQGIGPVVWKAEYEYHGELKYGDRLRIRTTVTIPKPTRGIFDHIIEHADTGQLICQARHYGLWMNRIKRRPYAFSEDVVARLVSSTAKG